MSFTSPHSVFNPMRDHSYVAIDLGTSKLKAYLCCLQPNEAIEIIDEVEVVDALKNQQLFPEVVLGIISKWRNSHGLLPVFVSSTVSVNMGWEQPPFVPCPVSAADIVAAHGEFEFEGQTINIIPGVSCQHANGHFDIMRSEEIQVLGWLQASATHRNGTYLICLPGTHTKWIRVKDSVIEMFKTAITGELYSLLVASNVLKEVSSNDFAPDAFDSGVQFALSSPLETLAHGLFNVRTKQMFEGLHANHASSYLSGLLIGSDVGAVMHANEWRIDEIDEVIIIGETHISDLFERVIRTQTDMLRCFHGKQATVLGFSAIRQRYLALQSH
jgi:2-dehydro-3-deoxygalactonokinase